MFIIIPPWYLFAYFSVEIYNSYLRRVDSFLSCTFLLLKIKKSSFHFFFLRYGAPSGYQKRGDHSPRPPFKTTSDRRCFPMNLAKKIFKKTHDRLLLYLTVTYCKSETFNIILKYTPIEITFHRTFSSQ